MASRIKTAWPGVSGETKPIVYKSFPEMMLLTSISIRVLAGWLDVGKLRIESNGALSQLIVLSLRLVVWIK